MPVRPHRGSWEVRVQHAGQRISRTFASRRDAQEFERRHRARVEDRRVGRTPRYSLEEALERWLTEDAASLKSIRSIKEHLRPIYILIRGRDLAEIVDVAAAVKADGHKHGRAPATTNRKLAALRRVANLAHLQWGWLDEPLGARIKMLAGERQRHTYLTRAEVARLASKAGKPAVRDAILLAAMTGLRRGELLSLTPESKVDGALVLPETKSGRPRIVPLPPEAARIALPIDCTVHELKHGFERARVAASLPRVRFHDLRHTYASWLVQGNQSLTVVRDLLGHSTLAVTGRYAHLATGHLRAAVKGAGIGRGLARARGRRGDIDKAPKKA